MRAILAFAAAAAVAVLASAQDPDECGFWISSCSPIPSDPNGQLAYSQMLVDGVSDGKFTWMREVYPNTPAQCGNNASPNLVVAYAGEWTDLGAATITGGRFWQLLADSIDVTPMTTDAAADLQNRCPCGGNWLAQSTRTLTYCDPISCPDTTWMGGYAGDGMVIGQPFFGFTIIAANSMTFSQLSSDYATVFYKMDQTNTFGTYNQNNTCDAPTSSSDFCGTWNQPCSPTFMVNTQSYNSIFMYDGPSATLYESGLFSYEATYYEDAACMNLYLSVIVGGTFMEQSISDVVTGGYYSEWNAPSVQVTPLTDVAVDELKADCPCGNPNAWVLGTTRELTTCIETCNTYWYWNTTVGNPLYGNFRRQDRDGDTELRFSSLSDSPAAGQANPLKANSFAYALNQGTCNYPHESESDWCGVWEKKCFAGQDVEDTDVTIAFTGSANNGSIGTGDGIFDRFRATYAPGKNCDPMTMKLSITETGFWSDMGPSTDVPGAHNILINVPAVTVVVSDPDTLTVLNNNALGCPCGGQWVLNIPRILTSCPIGTCPNTQWIDGSNKPLGVPAYGIIRAQEETIRMSRLSDNPDDGYSQPLDLEALPVPRADVCNPDEPSFTYCGVFTQPCRTDQVALVDSSSELTVQKNGAYSWVRTLFSPGYGCENDADLIISQSGTLQTYASSDSVIYGMQAEFKRSKILVTPLSANVVTRLSKDCPCAKSGSIWVIDKTVSLNCPAGTCSDFTLFEQPPGPSAYGSIQRLGSFFRVTDLSLDKVTGFDTPLSVHDFSYILTDDSVCKASSSSKGLRGGDVFILIFFLSAVVYFVGGMILNYRSGGVPTIPHVSFWTTLPGLISDGISFSLCQCCGLRGGSGFAYKRTTLSQDASDASGYGTL